MAEFATIQNTVSGLALALIIICVLIRAAMMRKRGVRVIVFGQTDKSDFVLVPVLLAILYAAFARSLGLPMWAPLLKHFWAGIVLGWFGLALCLLAATGFILSLVSFGASFRVGIDEDKSADLVTNGMFAISRNPIYVCFLFVIAGMFLIHRNIVIVVAAVIFSIVIHRQILREEKYLVSRYGDEYAAYCKKVRRYL